MSKHYVKKQFMKTKNSRLQPNSPKVRAPPTNPESIQLYRAALREIRGFPLPIFHKKIQYNVRELMEVYRFETREETVEALINDGYSDLKFLGSWKHVSPETLKAFFKKQEILEPN